MSSSGTIAGINNTNQFPAAPVPVAPGALLEVQKTGIGSYRQKISVGDLLSGGLATGLAAVGTNRANALVLTKRNNVIATAASAAVGVVLPPAAAIGVGNHVAVYNEAANSFHVYADGSDTIDAVAGATGVTLATGDWCRYLVTAALTYVSYKSRVIRSATVSDGVGYPLTAVGTNRATALLLSNRVNIITVAASAAVGVVLPPTTAIGVDGYMDVYVDGPGNAIHVYADGSDTIDGTAGATGVALTNDFWCRYYVPAPTRLLSFRYPIVRSA